MGACNFVLAPDRLSVPCTDEGLSGGTKGWQVPAQCAADTNGLHASMCLTNHSIFRKTTSPESCHHTLKHARTDRYTCV